MISGAKIFKFLLLTCSLLLAGCFVNSDQKPVLHVLQGDVFGSYYIVKYRGNLPPENFQPELDQFFSEFNNEFSTYQKNSVISEFNRSRANAPLKVSPRFIEMLKLSQKFYKDTEGAFDPTLGPVIKLWGFGGGERKQTPSANDLKKAMEQVGFEFIKWDENDLTVWKTKDFLQLDINAFAPGWVCDLIGEILFKKGITNYMVDLSGEILFKGTKAPEVSWVAGIEKPSLKHAQGVQQAFKIQDLAISTSGNYRQFFSDQGVRKSHIIDPRTGRPVTHTISSASVITTSGAAADAWSTAMMVLGSQGIALSEKNGIKVLLLDAKKPNLFDEIYSPSMSRFIKAHQL